MKYDEAIKCYDEYIKINPNYELKCNLLLNMNSYFLFKYFRML